jgi:hypothetical protein
VSGTSGTAGVSGTAGTSGIDTSIVARRQISANDTIVLTDAGRGIESSPLVGTLITLTIPDHTTAPIASGSQILLIRGSGGDFQITAAPGVTLFAPNGARLAKQWSMACLYKRFTNVWVLGGDTKI